MKFLKIIILLLFINIQFLHSQTSYQCYDMDGLEYYILTSPTSYSFISGNTMINIQVGDTNQTSTYIRYVPKNVVLGLDTLMVFNNGSICLVNGFKHEDFVIIKTLSKEESDILLGKSYNILSY